MVSFIYEATRLGKAIEAEVVGNTKLAAKWREAATLYQQLTEPSIQAARAYKEEKTDEAISWHNTGCALYYAANELEKAIEVEATGNDARATKWREAATLHQQSAEPSTQVARAHREGKIDEATSWYNVARGLYNAGYKLKKSIEAEAVGSIELAAKWREAARLQQQSVEPFTQAAKAYQVGKTGEAASWNQAGENFYNVAEALEKVIEAESAGKVAVAAMWSEVVTLQQKSIEPFLEAARAHVAGKTEEGERCHLAGAHFYEAATELAKSIEANVAENQPIVNEDPMAFQVEEDIRAGSAIYSKVAKEVKNANDFYNYALTIDPNKYASLFKKAWWNAIQKVRAIESICEEALQLHSERTISSDEPRGGYLYDIKAMFPLFPFYIEAEKAQKTYEIARDRFLAANFEADTTTDALWNIAMEQSKATELAWDQVIQSYAIKKNTLSESTQKKLTDFFNTAWVKKTLAAHSPLWLEAKRAEINSENFRKKALSICPDDHENFLLTWNDAIEKVKTVESAWDQVLQAYSHDKNLSPEKCHATWISYLNRIEYEKAHWAIQSLWLEAEKKGKIASTGRQKAEAANPEEIENFEALWAEAIEQCQPAELAWTHVVQRQKGLCNTFPESEKAAWDKEQNTALYWQLCYAARPHWITALRTDKSAAVARNEALKISPNDIEASETAWSTASQKAEEATLFWNHTLQQYQNLRGSVPNSEQSDWDVYINMAQAQKEYWRAQYDFFQSKKEEQQKQSQPLHAELSTPPKKGFFGKLFGPK